MIEIPATIKNKKLVARRREQLIKSGIKLFGRKGFHSTTLKDIAEDAGVSYGNIYCYVGSKEDIFFLIHDFLYRKSMDLFDRSIEDLKDPLERLRGIIGCEFKILDSWSDATLLMYQEAHILNETYLKELLQRERLRLERMETVIADCVDRGLLRPCNVRLTANLIKSMLDAWVLKRWDLRGHTSRREAEETIVDTIMNGLLKDRKEQTVSIAKHGIESNLALVANGGTILGKALCHFLQEKGLRVIAYVDQIVQSREYPDKEFDAMSLYSYENDGPLNAALIDRMEEENGPVEIYVHDLGVGNTEIDNTAERAFDASQWMNKNIFNAHQVMVHLREIMAKRSAGRILFMTPWAWDRHLDIAYYEATQAAIAALTQSFSCEMAPFGVNVNCIAPGFIKSVRPSPLELECSDELIKDVPRGCMGEIQDVLDAVWFFISNNSKYVTGQVMKISGGY
ncbi:SDR family oxidoreductase [uncultured Desulfosarcina sp.]|uniref:SDR family oxidoreductase n=1 Tax=uncultured Desulfosarcina sp. TaxID=218289 RepID=UPI0029C90642|nr:SDR family oxidoreductase [uncultured Desulfosarcina sp.]